MLENLQEFTPTLGESGYFTDYTQQSNDAIIHVNTGREPDQENLVFESEATPFSHDMNLDPSGHTSGMRLHNFEYNSPALGLFPPLTHQSDYVGEIQNTNYGIGPVDNTSVTSKRNCGSLRHENSSISASEETFLYPRASWREDDMELQTDTVHSHGEEFSMVKYSEGGAYTQWDVTDTSQSVDVPRNFRQDRQPIDWSAESQTVSAFDTNPAREGILEVNLCVSLGSVYEDVTDTERPDAVGATFGERYTSGRFHYSPTHEGDKNTSSWLATNSMSQIQLATSPTCLNVFPEIKNGCYYSSPETTAIDHNTLQTGPSVASEVQEDVSLKLKSLTHNVRQNNSEQNSTKSGTEKVNFFTGSACVPQTMSTNNAKSVALATSCLHRSDDNDYCGNVEECHSQTVETLSDKSSDCTPHPMCTRSVDTTGGSTANISVAGCESDDNCSDNKQTCRLASTRQKRSTWTIDSIQQELEVLEERRKKRGGPSNSVQQRLDNYKLQTMAKTKGSGLVDVDYMLCSGVTVAGFKPRAIIR